MICNNPLKHQGPQAIYCDKCALEMRDEALKMIKTAFECGYESARSSTSEFPDNVELDNDMAAFFTKEKPLSKYISYTENIKETVDSF